MLSVLTSQTTLYGKTQEATQTFQRDIDYHCQKTYQQDLYRYHHTFEILPIRHYTFVHYIFYSHNHKQIILSAQ